MSRADKARYRANLLAVMRSQEEVGTLVSGVTADGARHVEFIPIGAIAQTSVRSYLRVRYAMNFAISREAVEQAMREDGMIE